jgi:hypothetical protein
MRGDDNDWVGARKYGASATCSAIVRCCWEKLTLVEEVPVTFSYDGAKHLVLRGTPDDLEDLQSASANQREWGHGRAIRRLP